MVEISSTVIENNVEGVGKKSNLMKDIKNISLPTDWAPSERILCDLELLLNGSLYPLEGFMCSDDYYSVLNNMTLKSGKIFPMPIVFPIPKLSMPSNLHWDNNSETSTAQNSVESLSKEKNFSINIRDSVGSIVAELIIQDIYEPNIELEMEKVLGTTDINHPYVQHLTENYKNCYYVGGKLIKRATIEHFDFCKYRLSPQQVKNYLSEKYNLNDINIVGFQTRNPMHKSHFEITVSCVEKVQQETNKKTILLLTPAIGPTQPGDVPFHTRVQCYLKILPYYAQKGIEVKLVLITLAMRMAGPREALWHAIIRQNYGCTHFILGRDHAGPSSKSSLNVPFYKPYDAHSLLLSKQELLNIRPVFAQNMCYISKLGKYVQEDKIPDNENPMSLSGSELRSMLKKDQDIPNWYSFPEVVFYLKKTYPPLYKSGVVLYFTGLPCSGKSTLANACKAALLERLNETRNVTLLDADIIRQHLSKGLGFSEADRSANVRRIGYVASEIAKHKGICLVANIAPYEKDRSYNRQLTNTQGATYIEIYVSTPLEICEKRDIKELFRKARLGVVKNFTGISDPYEIPKNPELSLDSSNNLQLIVSKILKYLESKNIILPSDS